MSTPDSPNRRHFIASMAGVAAAATVLPLARAGAAITDGAASPEAGGKWDDSWTQRLGKHRVVFDHWELEQEPGAWAVPDVMDAFHEVLGTTDADLGFVLVIRHHAVPLFMSDAMWAKYDISKDMKEKDEKTKQPYRVNPMRELVTRLQGRGVTVLGCNRAVMGFTSRLATQVKVPVDDMRREVMASLMPGVTLLPNGLYALARAQDVGCGFMR